MNNNLYKHRLEFAIPTNDKFLLAIATLIHSTIELENTYNVKIDTLKVEISSNDDILMFNITIASADVQTCDEAVEDFLDVLSSLFTNCTTLVPLIVKDYIL